MTSTQHSRAPAILLATGLGLAALLATSLPAAAQKVKIETQGQAAVEAEARKLDAAAVAKAIGAPSAGQGQVLFYRAGTSPGEAIVLSRDDATDFVTLAPGMFVVVPQAPGYHGYGTSSGAGLSVQVAAGKTEYVQVIRDRAGRPALRRTNATAFQRAAR